MDRFPCECALRANYSSYGIHLHPRLFLVGTKSGVYIGTLSVCFSAHLVRKPLHSFRDAF
ncbi:hypothetical protein F9K99_19465 [Brucella anthropi]|nr:hypothetical protein F9L05_17290 [Brucella anthropi]KAB2777259.1 hypothetical protein F9K99_19465 [Brucella anthropi]RRY06264.1 hypothetical protein EGJ58_18910 [Brucella anthropi]